MAVISRAFGHNAAEKALGIVRKVAAVCVVFKEDLPLQMQQSFADLRQMMTGVAPLNGEGSIRATVRKMSVCQTDECARLILSLYSDIIRYNDNGQELLPLDVTDSQRVPPFLIKSN